MKRKQNTDMILSLFQRFQRKNRIKNLADATIVFYSSNFEIFYGYLRGIHIDFVKDIDSDVIDDYILFLKKRYDKAVSINTNLRAVRAFLYWCMRNNVLQSFKIRLLKEPEAPLKLYSDKDVKRLIKKPNLKKCSFTTYRNWVLT